MKCIPSERCNESALLRFPIAKACKVAQLNYKCQFLKIFHGKIMFCLLSRTATRQQPKGECGRVLMIFLYDSAIASP